MCVHVLCVNMTLCFFHGYIYPCFFKSTSLNVWTPRSDIRHIRRLWRVRAPAHTHTYDMQTLARTLNCMLSFLSDPHRAQCECQPVAILPSTPVHQFLPRGPQSYPRGLGPALPQSLFTQRKCQDQVWERQQFFLCTVDSWYIPDKS